MPQELAQQLFECGGALILQDFPEGCEFGVDCRSWTIGPKFLGLKMIPPGIHFFYVNVPGAPRIAFFHDFKPKEIVLRKWDKEKEDFTEYTSNEMELQRLRDGLRNIDNNLGPYPYADFQQWVSLSSFIQRATIERLSPPNKLRKITSQSELTTMETELEKKLADPRGLSIVDREHRGRVRFTDESGLPLMVEKEESKLGFSEVPQTTLADTQLKKVGIDSSERLIKLLDKLGGDYKALLAELQFAFIVFLIGQVYEGFDQWKRIIHLVCSCKAALRSHGEFFAELLMVLHFQMKMFTDEFFEDTLASNNFIISTLSLLFANIEDELPADNALRMKASKFKMLLEKKFSRSFSLPDD